MRSNGIDLNRPSNMWIISKIFKKYHFTQCPNAEFAKKHNLLHVLPLMCNCDLFGIEQLHGTLIRCGTCGNSDICDCCVVGCKNPLAKEYEIVTDENGFRKQRL